MTVSKAGFKTVPDPPRRDVPGRKERTDGAGELSELQMGEL